MNALLEYNCKAEFSDNILPYAGTFDGNNAILTPAVSAGASVIYDVNNYFTGKQSIKSFVPDSNTVNFNLGEALNIIVKKTGRYIFSAKIKHEMPDNFYFAHQLLIRLSTNGNFTNKECLITLPVTGDSPYPNLKRGSWYTFWADFDFQANDAVNFAFAHTAEQTNIDAGSQIWIDGLKFEYDDRNLGKPSFYSRPKNGLELLPQIDGNYNVNIASGVATLIEA